MKDQVTRRKSTRIMQILPSLGFGGAERIVVSIAKGLDKDKYSVCVFCLSKSGPLKREIEEGGVQVIIPKNKRKPISALFGFAYSIVKVIHELSFLMKKQHIDIVHTHLHGASEILGFFSAKIARVSIVVSTCHNVDGWFNKYKYLKKLLYGFVVNHSQKVISVAGIVERYIKRQVKINPCKLTIIQNGIDLEERNITMDTDRIQSTFGLSPKDKVITTVASLTTQKGHIYLLKAVPMIISKYPESKFLIVGDGILRDFLRRQVAYLNISEHIRFSGNRTDISAILSITDIFVLPSLWEGLPLAPLEAMGIGVPVVATDIPIMREIIIDGETGILVPPRDPDSIAKSIVYLLNNLKEASRMGVAGKQRVEKLYDAKKMVAKVERLYEDLLSQGKRK